MNPNASSVAVATQRHLTEGAAGKFRFSKLRYPTGSEYQTFAVWQLRHCALVAYVNTRNFHLAIAFAKALFSST